MCANRGLVLGCAVLVLLTCFAAEAKDGSGVKTILVDCDKGQTIGKALEKKADELIIEISGICQEDVVIERNNVTLRGVMPGATVVAASSTAIFLDRVSRVSIEDLTAQGGPEGPGEIGGAGIGVWLSTGVSVSNLVVENDKGKGMTVVGSTVTISDSVFRNNDGYGLQGNASSLVFLGSEIELSNNRYEGLLLSFQSALISLAAIRANGNRKGIWLEQNSSAGLRGSVEVTGNDSNGIGVENGSVLELGDVEASENENGMMAMTGGQILIHKDGAANIHDNTNSGLSATDGGFFKFYGTVESNGTDGVYLHGSSATFHDSTIRGNSSSDVVLLFGSRADFEGVNDVGIVVCDDTVLVEGNVSCP